MYKDHPIFLESIQFIRSQLKNSNFNGIELKVLERLIHTSGDFDIQSLLKFSSKACDKAIKAIKAGAPILTDTEMASAAIKSMAKSTHGNKVFSVKQWIDKDLVKSSTKTAYGIERAWIDITKKYNGEKSPIAIFGSSPTALEKLMDLLEGDHTKPSLIVGMPVGFIGVENSKKRLLNSEYQYIVLKSTKGGAAMAGATVNALLRESVGSS